VLCRASKCPGQGAIVNLQARAAFLAGDFEGAIRLAKQALPLNRSAKDEEETANSSRITADAQLASGRHAAAANAYATALAVDKRLGLDAKILADLIGLGRAAAGGGRSSEARGWFERARAVALASGDEAGATEVEALIEALPLVR
jgi:tetratricopeptide (TPR) repeat protein